MMIDIIKEAAIEAIESMNPMKVYIGTVTNGLPDIKILLNHNNKIILDREDLFIPKRIIELKGKATINDIDRNVEVEVEPKVGDNVAVIRIQGGQQYLLMDIVE